jgi:NADH-quinone oxidoreductase subunit L
MDHPIQSDFIRWIVFLPLLGAIINGLLGAKIQKSMGKSAISFLACAPVIAAFGLSLYAFFILKSLEPEKRFLIDSLYTWIELGSLKVDMAFSVDPLSAVMILVVTGVGGLIHIYATAYMHDDRAFWRFFAYLNLFMAAMLTLVTADNMLLMFVGWEGVGLCSYALIGFWYQDQNNARAGNKAFIVNRVGDFGFILGTFLIFWSLDAQGHGTMTFREMAQWASTLQGQEIWGIGVVTLATLLLFVGATGKSAQIPLHVWLPDAMAGPTPVSALIHAATMVTAGVYMVARLNFFFSMAPLTLHVIAIIGIATSLLAASIALTQVDIKRVLAYSTVSQLGYMFLGAGVGAYAAAIFHLMTHAFFKACLFLGSGSVIHAMGGEQDMRKMGGLRHQMPYTFWTFAIAVLAIAGTPLTAGFFSKDEILWQAFSSEHGSPILWSLGVLGAGMTAFYMFRHGLLR